MKKKNNHCVNIISINPNYGLKASSKISNMLFETNQADEILKRISQTSQSDAVKGGFAAETWHAESFNLDAILKDKSVRAYTDNYPNSPLVKNDTVNDIVVMDGKQKVYGAQVKYYKNGEATQKAFREVKDGVAKYKDSDAFLAPSDQINQVKESAHKTVLKNQETRPEVAKAAEDISNKATDKIQVDGVESKTLTKKQSEHLGTGKESGKHLRQDMKNQYLSKATIQQSVKAAQSAAIATAIIAGSINTFQYLKLAREGKMTAEDATFEIVKNTALAAGDSALKAGASTAVISHLTRNFPQLFAGSIFKRTLLSSGTAAGVVCVVDVIKNCVLFSMGKISFAELEQRTGKGIYQGGAGAVGASIGCSIGATGGPPGMFIGAVIGGIITTLAADIAIDNLIEKPFRQALENTQNLVDSGRVMQESLSYLAKGISFYEEFELKMEQSETLFNSQIRTIETQSISLQKKIRKL
ncbi:hypothetical protein [Pasteurella multocida]|uniref:hypothetical protein n=1 Tax=Pasteurella multocida TaxID=747 RepID=UPI00061A81E7|nr:hypothetical protein [Pasteurella multocida]AKD40039.1 hypothetical protein I927_04050 [Pasteurella multocida OH1905]URJ91758.1 hypothetical protein M9415_03415 [Pasteurella multocida]WRK04355.1 hypothetical protein RFF10_06320 [Pasteurella multocida]HDR1787999.1 hypothetical protein [Pasteurella multocida]